jgi:hypothetical protein
LPECVVTLVASQFDGPRSDAFRTIRGVCKPWRADFAVTKATVPEGAEATIGRVLQSLPNLQSLTVVKNTSENLMTDIRLIERRVPELKRFVFDECDLYRCRQPLSKCLPTHTRELELSYCRLDNRVIKNLHRPRCLVSLTVHIDAEANDIDDGSMSSFCSEVFTLMPSLRLLDLDHFYMETDDTREPDLPDLTSLTIAGSVVSSQVFIGGLPRLEHLDLESTYFKNVSMGGSFWVQYLPVSITSLNIRNSYPGESKILSARFEILASRLPFLSTLELGSDDQVTNDVLAVIGGMRSLSSLSNYFS